MPSARSLSLKRQSTDQNDVAIQRRAFLPVPLLSLPRTLKGLRYLRQISNNIKAATACFCSRRPPAQTTSGRQHKTWEPGSADTGGLAFAGGVTAWTASQRTSPDGETSETSPQHAAGQDSMGNVFLIADSITSICSSTPIQSGRRTRRSEIAFVTSMEPETRA